MRILLATTLVLSAFIGRANAEQLNRFDHKVILRSIQCEMGKAAAADEVVAAVKGRPVMGVGTVGIEEYTVRELGLRAKVFALFSGEATITDDFKTGYTVPFHYNLHVANMQACNDRNVASVGIQNCVVTNADRFQEYWTIGQSITCYQEGNGTKSVKAGLGGEYWVVNADVHGAYTDKLTYKLTMTIPGSGKPPEPTAVVSNPFFAPPVFTAAQRTAAIPTRMHSGEMAWRSSVSQTRSAYAQASWHRKSSRLNASTSLQHQKIAMR